MWINVPWQLCSNPKLSQFIAGLFSFFTIPLNQNTLLPRYNFRKKIKVLKCFFSGEIFYIFFPFYGSGEQKNTSCMSSLKHCFLKTGTVWNSSPVWGRNVTGKVSRSSPICNKRPNSWSMRINYFTSNCNSHIKNYLVLQFYCFEILGLLQYINHIAFSPTINIFIKYYHSNLLYLSQWNQNCNKLICSLVSHHLGW